MKKFLKIYHGSANFCSKERGCGSNQYQSISNIHKYLFLIVFMVIQIGASNAQILDNYIKEAVENNLGLQASFKQYQVSLEKVNQVSLDNPQLNIGIYTRPMELLMGNQRAEASIMQMFPWFGMLKTQKDEATLMAEAQYEAFREERNRLVFQVKDTYFQLLQLQHTIDITQENLEILKVLEELAIVRYQGGNTSGTVSSLSKVLGNSNPSSGATAQSDGMNMAGSSSSSAPMGQNTAGNGMNSMPSSSGKLTDVLRLQVQIKALESELSQLEVNKRPLVTKFNQLIGRERNEDVEIAAQENLTNINGWEEVYLDSILLNNPMLMMLEKESLAYRKQAEMAKLEGSPMLGAGLNYMVFSPRPESGMIGGMDGMEYMPSGMGNNMVMPMVSMTLPIYRKKYKSMQSEAILWMESSQKQKIELENLLATEFETISTSIKDSERKLKLLEEQIELMQQTLEISVTSYSSEGSSMEEIFSIQRELLDFKLEKLTTEIERQVAIARLESLIGI
ncbi:TolC family protein [Shivajiella indica]|uniref:TolC family protein n=1 Tax=Shivajiella indica TaxID=872115 RepID=A0ABW5BC11_9BACT